VNVVTGVFSYTGGYIARELLQRGEPVKTLSRAPAPGHPLSREVAFGRLSFDDPVVLQAELRGASTLYNTYWIRAPHGGTTFATAVANTRVLLDAARRAGVLRVVHIGVTNASEDSPFPYFRYKALADREVRASKLSYAIVRPTLVFGVGDLLLNNVAWALRHFPLFLIPRGGDYPIQPVAAEDVARLAVEAGESKTDLELDAAGPDTFSFCDLIALVRKVVGARSHLISVPPPATRLGLAGLELLVRDKMLRREELDAVMAGMLATSGPPTGRLRLVDWLEAHGNTLGRRYVSERARDWR
jgi:uncharacterized protein YbjT (DUF2867 family)